MTRVKTRLFALLSLVVLVEFLSTSAVRGLPQKARHSKQAELWRKLPPKPDAPRPFTLPAVREKRFENGLTVLFIEDHSSPIVTILVGIPLAMTRSGDIAELTSQVALAEATAELITEGAGSRTSEQVAREVETLGGRLSSSANDDYAEVALSVVAENAERMMDLLGDVLLRPAFPESEVTLYKRNRIQTVVVQRQDPAFLAGEQFDRIVFGSHPYAISAPTPPSIDALDREKLAEFYSSNFGPGGSVAIIGGDFDASRMEMKAREVLGGWKAPQKKSTNVQPIAFPRATERRVYLVNRPGSEQADFRIGTLAVRRSSPEYFPLLVANAILGAGTGSRLFLNIRERKGYAYDVYSSVGALREAGTFFGGAETRTEVTARAIKEMLTEFDRLAAVKVGPRELQGAKNYLTGLFSLSLSTQGGVAERIMQTYMLDLGRDYLEAYRSRIESVTAEQVQEVARKYILSDRPAIVVVGDASKLARELRTIGPVEVLDTEGKPAKQSAP
ncbi:MAG TPA: pitrilysin family protein [Blastocatellia bacterium]|nr:pitrilysin family protein [Blastocatellia bacterium]